jgi:hypothetical protein
MSSTKKFVKRQDKVASEIAKGMFTSAAAPRSSNKENAPYYKGAKVDPKKVMTNQKRTEIFEMMKDPKMQLRNSLYTRMCIHSKEECTEGIYCVFAHSEAELRKPKCWFGEFCKKSAKVCTWDHDPNHKIPELPPAKPKVDCQKKEEEKFIIPFADSDDEEEIIEEVEEDDEELVLVSEACPDCTSPIHFLQETITSPTEMIVAEPLCREQLVISRKEYEHYVMQGIDLSRFEVIIQDSNAMEIESHDQPLSEEDRLSEEKARDQWAIANPMKSWKEYTSPYASPSPSPIPCSMSQESEVVIQMARRERKQRRVVLDLFADDQEYEDLIKKIKMIAM